jgi:hypothetical protein
MPLNAERIALPIRLRARGRVGDLAIAPAQADRDGQFVVHKLELPADALGVAGVVHPFGFIDLGAQLW